MNGGRPNLVYSTGPGPDLKPVPELDNKDQTHYKT